MCYKRYTDNVFYRTTREGVKDTLAYHEVLVDMPGKCEQGHSKGKWTLYRKWWASEGRVGVSRLLYQLHGRLRQEDYKFKVYANYRGSSVVAWAT